MQIDMNVSTSMNTVGASRHIEGNEKTHNTAGGIKKEHKQVAVKDLPTTVEVRYKEEDLVEAVEAANEQFYIYDRKFEVSIHEKTRQIMVKVIDAATDDVIREIPPEKMLDAVADRWKMAGILVDERV